MDETEKRIRQAIKQYGPVARRVILRLGKEKGEFEPWNMEPDTLEPDFAGYLACLNLSRTHKAVEKRMSDQKKLKTFKKREVAAETKSKIKFAKRKHKEKVESESEIK